jgi:hypothetical protein
MQFLEYTKKENNERAADDGDNDASKKHKNNFNLNDQIDMCLSKMIRDQNNDSSKKIPPGFYEFANSPQFKDLLQAVLDYHRELFRLENKQQVLEQEAK